MALVSSVLMVLPERCVSDRDEEDKDLHLSYLCLACYDTGEIN